MKAVKVRLITIMVVVAIFVLILGVGRASTGAGAYFANLSNEPLNYNDSNLTVSDFKKNAAMEGNVYWVLDCIGEEYTETTSESGATLSTHTDAYYYAIPFDDNTALLLKTDADSELEELIDALWILSDPYYEEYKEIDDEYVYYEPYEYLLEEGAYVEGVLVENEEDMVDLYEEWKEDYPEFIEELFEAYGLECDADKLELIPYTLDCTKSVEDYAGLFYSGMAIILVFVVIAVIAVILIIKAFKGGSGRNNQYATANAMGGYDQYNGFNQANNYNQPNDFQPNSYQPNNYQSNIPQQSNSQYTAQPMQNNNNGSSYIPTPVNSDLNNSNNSSENGVNLRKD